MDEVIVRNNRTYSDDPSHRGGIFVGSDLTATAITVTNNLAYDCGCGGDKAHGIELLAGLGKLPLGDLDLGEVKRLARRGETLVKCGTVGYTLIVAKMS